MKKEILKTRFYKKRGWVLVDEVVSMPGCPPVTLKSAYSWPELFYIGENKKAFCLNRIYGIQSFYPLKAFKIAQLSEAERAKKILIEGSDLDLKSTPCCLIGWSPSDSSWYGWSRAINGFTIGSKIAKGDLGYKPAGKRDFLDRHMSFWGFNPDGTCKQDYKRISNVKGVEIINILEDTKDPNGQIPGKGIQIKYKTYLKDGSNFISSPFHPYPDVWGRGAWEAKTLDDARQMAIDFAENGL